MSINWQLAGRPYDALQSLGAYGQARQDAMREQQFADAQADRAREAEGRDAIGSLLRLGMQTAPIRPSMHSGVQGLMDTGAAGGQAAPGVSDRVRGLMDAGRAAAFDRLTRADPERAMRYQQQERQATKEQLAIYRDLNAQALQLMGGVTDQASYDAAKQRGAALYARYGLSLDEYQLPDEYSPEVVRGLMMQALDTEHQLTQMRQDRRLDADIEDDEQDNARADRLADNTIRNTGDMIDDRAARRGLIARGQNMTDARGRYGIAVASSDRRRGQDIASADRHRAQDRQRGRAPAAPTASAGGIVSVKSGAEAQQLPPGTMFKTPDGRIMRR